MYFARAISQTTGSGEWVGASRDGDNGSAEFYGGQMKAALEAVIGAVNATAGTYIGIANFVDALANEYDAAPEGSESWGPKFDYKPSLPHDCSNSIHFMISSPTLQDSIHIKKRQEASMPTVNESNQVPYAEAEWTLETRPPANSTNSISVGSGPTTSAEAVEAYPSKKVSQEELSKNPAAQEMAEEGDVYRMKLPFNATTSTSSL